MCFELKQANYFGVNNASACLAEILRQIYSEHCYVNCKRLRDRVETYKLLRLAPDNCDYTSNFYSNLPSVVADFFSLVNV